MAKAISYRFIIAYAIEKKAYINKLSLNPIIIL
jgi:hypothetical protein